MIHKAKKNSDELQAPVKCTCPHSASTSTITTEGGDEPVGKTPEDPVDDYYKYVCIYYSVFGLFSDQSATHLLFHNNRNLFRSLNKDNLKDNRK